MGPQKWLCWNQQRTSIFARSCFFFLFVCCFVLNHPPSNTLNVSLLQNKTALGIYSFLIPLNLSRFAQRQSYKHECYQGTKQQWCNFQGFFQRKKIIRKKLSRNIILFDKFKESPSGFKRFDKSKKLIPSSQRKLCRVNNPFKNK